MKKIAILTLLALVASACQKENIQSKSLGASKDNTSQLSAGGPVVPAPITQSPLPPPVVTLPAPTGKAAQLSGTYAGYGTGTVLALTNQFNLCIQVRFSAGQFDGDALPGYSMGIGSLTRDSNNLNFFNDARIAGSDNDPDPFYRALTII